MVIALAALLASSFATAHGGYYRPRAHFGFYFGAPAYWYYPAPYYYPPAYYPPAYGYPSFAFQPSTPVYIEKGGNGNSYAPPEQTEGYWYYCPEARAYYPYVKQCAGGWKRVSPQPPT